MQPNLHQRSSPHMGLRMETVSISQLIAELLADHRLAMIRCQIRVELDVQSLEATVDSNLVKKALNGLIENAIRSTPSGGEITITTIDGQHHWEIEVADSSNKDQAVQLDQTQPWNLVYLIHVAMFSTDYSV